MPKSKKRDKTKERRSRAIQLTATTVRRTPKTVEIPIDKTHTPEWMAEPDPLFEGLYLKYLRGRIPGFLTRVPMDCIRPGFYVANRNFEYVCDRPPEDVIYGQMCSIRNGARPPLHLYTNPNPNDNVRFLCPDEVAVYLAYQKLKIRSAPAIVFGRGKQPLPFSALEAKVVSAAAEAGPRVCSLVSTRTPEKLHSFFGLKLPDDPFEVIGRLSKELENRIARLRLFHSPEVEKLHYHHMVFSAMVRAQETLRGIEILIRQDLWYQALALLRVLYEIHLNFYFDWLQPETNYRFLAGAAVFSDNLGQQKRSTAEELIAKGMHPTKAETHSNIIWRPVVLAGTVSEKARLPKVAIAYHKDIYSFLSRISHQDFEVASLHANRFENETFLKIEDDVKTTYLRFMDFIMSEFCICIEEDIGVANDLQS
ncbi:hypothetical protein NX783_13560 [Massilia kyonggiensis]|nr:hypothetical protein [Massilia kyonggiensis]